MAPGEKENAENIFDMDISEVGARGVLATDGTTQSGAKKSSRLFNIDNSQENADFTKFRQLDIPGVGHIYGIFDRAGVDYMAEDGAQKIVEFAESHPWVDDLDPESRAIISKAREDAKAKTEK